MEFTTAQSDAIQNEGHTIITACPGAGKTRVLIERSARLLRSQTNNLALVTFTRAATEEMKVRISQRVQTKRASINTFHGFACRQFRTLRNGKKIASSIETRNAIWSAIRITKTKLTYDEAAGVIEQYNGQLYPNRLEQDDKHAWDVFNTYEKIIETQKQYDLKIPFGHDAGDKVLKHFSAMIKAHPYEEVAYDIYPLENSAPGVGMGMLGELEDEMDEMVFLNFVKDRFGLFLHWGLYS